LIIVFLRGAGEKGRSIRERASEATGNMTVMVLRDRDTKMLMATVVPRKGATGEFAARRAAAFCTEIGYGGTGVIMKSDQEPALKALVEDISRRRSPAKTILEHSPVGSSQSNGIVERAIQSYEGMLRTIKGGLEDRWDAKIPDGHAIFAWMSEYCGFLLNRFEVGADGKTAIERLKGKKSKHQGLEFGEGLLFKKKRTHQPKDTSVWEDGIYPGIRGLSGENIVGTKSGVWKTRTVQRKPKEHRWGQENVEMVGGVPWSTQGGKEEGEPDGDMPTEVIKLEARKVGESEAEIIKESIDVPRSFLISRTDLEKHGFTSKCPGCTSLIKRAARQAHTIECRERMKIAMADEPKVKDAREREMNFHEKVYEDMRAKIKKKGEEGASVDSRAGKIDRLVHRVRRKEKMQILSEVERKRKKKV